MQQRHLLLKGPSLYKEQYFKHISLSGEAMELIERDPKDKDLIRLNRLLLEQAYPLEITKRPKFSSLLEREWGELAAYKLGKIPSHGLKRAENGTWEPITEETFKNNTARFLGMLALPINAENSEICGLGLNTDTFCLAMLSCVSLASEWLHWLSKRRFAVRQHEADEEVGKVREIYTQFDSVYI